MTQAPDRGTLTDRIVLLLETTGFPVGDAGAPEPDPNRTLQAGWNGEPNAPGSVYVPYLVVTPQTATISSGPMDDPQGDFRVPYAMSIFGANRKQTESLGNVARKTLSALKAVVLDLDGISYKVQQVWFDALGAVGRVDATSPSTYGEVDTFTVWLTK